MEGVVLRRLAREGGGRSPPPRALRSVQDQLLRRRGAIYSPRRLSKMPRRINRRAMLVLSGLSWRRAIGFAILPELVVGGDESFGFQGLQVLLHVKRLGVHLWLLGVDRMLGAVPIAAVRWPVLKCDHLWAAELASVPPEVGADRWPMDQAVTCQCHPGGVKERGWLLAMLTCRSYGSCTYVVPWGTPRLATSGSPWVRLWVRVLPLGQPFPFVAGGGCCHLVSPFPCYGGITLSALVRGACWPLGAAGGIRAPRRASPLHVAARSASLGGCWAARTYTSHGRVSGGQRTRSRAIAHLSRRCHRHRGRYA